MKRHIRTIALLALVAMFAVVFTVAVSAMATPDEATADEIAPVIPAEPEPSDEAPQTVTEGGIYTQDQINVTASTHVFKEEKVLLVTLDNKNADKAYSVDVNVSYIAPDGTVMGSETKTFDQLTSDESKNFIFRPGYDFADYRLETVTEVYANNIWKKGINVEFKFWEYGFDYDEDRGWAVCPTVVIDNAAGEELIVTDIEVVLFDENGDIYDIIYKGAELWINDGDVDNYKQFEDSVLVPDHMMVVADHVTDCDVKLSGFMSYEIIHPTQSPWYEDVIAFNE